MEEKKIMKQKLYSAILGSMRRWRIPSNYEGTDLIRGAVYGMIDHPSYTIKEAIEKAYKASKNPLACSSYDEAIESMFYCASDCFKENEEKEGAVHNLLKKLTKESKYYFYLTLVADMLMEDGVQKDTIEHEILKTLAFELMQKPEVTIQEIYLEVYQAVLYAYPDSFEVAFGELNEYTEKATKGMTAFNYAKNIVGRINMSLSNL